MSSDTSKLSRRNVLLGTALAGAATAIGQDVDAAPAAPEAASDDPRRVVLKDTPHTRAYYALARNS
ncbi:twin-arginine translocation signal domain-containing protein [Palleronia sp.]|uniref:twin-arginine translocation signal domain-containing protein n=1 Tax=Palleronia sp. TaxID=1940284 RepID=UPI0035C8185D